MTEVAARPARTERNILPKKNENLNKRLTQCGPRHRPGRAAPGMSPAVTATSRLRRGRRAHSRRKTVNTMRL